MEDTKKLNLRGAADRVGVGTSSILYWIMSGKLEASKVNGHWVIDEAKLLEADRRAKGSSRAGRRGPRLASSKG